MGIGFHFFNVDVTDGAPSSDSPLERHDSYNIELYFGIPYFLICPFGVFKENSGRMRPPSPPCSTSMTSYWRSGVEVSI